MNWTIGSRASASDAHGTSFKSSCPGRAPGPLDPNLASAAELEALPGIGPALAQRIVDDREARGPFASTAELARVPGIGPVRLAAIRAALGEP